MPKQSAPDGTAQQLPVGRLSSFEDDDTAPDLGELLQRRRPAGRTEPPVISATTNSPLPLVHDQQADGAQPDPAPAHSERQNRIRSSSVHIPAPLIERIVAERTRDGHSNGEIVIAALEYAHDRLGELIARRGATGGGLFASRTSRGKRLSDGPLTPLNVRLFEQDYVVIDELVARFGAFSRGDLISTALTAYFDRPVGR